MVSVSISAILLFPSLYLQASAVLLSILDKATATANLPFTRVPERVFVTLSFFGAWPGLILSFLLLNHKVSRRKRTFQLRICTSVLVAVLFKRVFVFGSDWTDRAYVFVVAFVVWTVLDLALRISGA